MISLSHDRIEKSTLCISRKPERVGSSLHRNAFFGALIMQVDDSTFMTEYPILGFARALKIIAFSFSIDGEKLVYYDPESLSPWLNFTLQKNNILIEAVDYIRPIADHDPVRTETLVFSATTKLDELRTAADEYFERVLAEFSEYFPPLKTDPAILKWLNANSDPNTFTYEN